MTIKEQYKVSSVNSSTIKDWVLKKHYLKKMPPVVKAFGLFKGNELIGIITYGVPSRAYNSAGKIFGGIKVPTYELNRLVVNDKLEKNVLSYFVSQTIKTFEKPCLIITFADPNQGHHGYIYQALNFLYTGETTDTRYFVHKRTGKIIHLRTFTEKYSTEENGELHGIERRNYEHGKYRYLLILADKKLKKKLLNNLTWDILPYPKGQNKYYDASYKPKVSKHNFW